MLGADGGSHWAPGRGNSREGGWYCQPCSPKWRNIVNAPRISPRISVNHEVSGSPKQTDSRDSKTSFTTCGRYKVMKIKKLGQKPTVNKNSRMIR